MLIKDVHAGLNAQCTRVRNGCSAACGMHGVGRVDVHMHGKFKSIKCKKTCVVAVRVVGDLAIHDPGAVANLHRHSTRTPVGYMWLDC